MKLLARSKKDNAIIYSSDETPKIAIVIAAYNEEKVINEKIESTLKTNYPKDQFQIFIGSDNSNDRTNEIIENYTKITDKITFKNFTDRGGKQEVLNKLFKDYIPKNKFNICIMTDANIIFNEDTLHQLVKHFKNENIGIVCANIKNKNIKERGISKQEQFYISNENTLKINEGKVFGSSIAAFGACYSIKRELVPIIPKNILMEDFFISMHVLKEGKQIITEADAICHEDLPETISEEFKRKKRISTGNFQNLAIYFPMLFKSKFGISFSFLSHKILRWIGPFLIIFAYFSLWYLCSQPFYLALLLFCHFILFLAILDYILMLININVNLLRFIRYFLAMNIALFIGFFKYAQGVKTNIWQPTKRNE
ncbi:MAG: cellulose synthase/poly-beta-1,6-N-acetylglucosamine synthase-like glycosyltransferase [Planctomycetota bacterium]|jgi:cellulose synthase/poly-beta-1,6-N-acetylglucosamine synthase-like glycosyltransferase